MNRDSKLLEKRRKMVGLLFELKKSNEISSKAAWIEISRALTISVQTVNNDLAAYNKSRVMWV